MSINQKLLELVLYKLIVRLFETEFIAAIDVGRKIVWMWNLLTKLGYSLSKPSTLHVDNQSAVAVSKNLEHHECMKHLNLRFF